MKKEIIVQIICYYFLLLFAYASLSKLFIYNIFLGDLHRAPLTRQAPLLFSILVPTIEISIGIMLMIDKTRKLGLLAAFLLMAIFSAYVWYVLDMTNERPCSCGGIFRTMTWRTHFIFNCVSTALAFIGLVINTIDTKRVDNKAILLQQ